MKRRSKRPPERRPIRAAGVILAFLAILFVGVRLLTAWLLRDEVNGDLAIVQMMVRDMTTGGPIPAFFYGQAYMGSLEPVLNALFHLLCGRTNFGTELGTAFFFVLMAWSVTRMARRAGGDWAAVAALALCVVGPMPFAHYAVSPRGGYGVLLFTTAGLLDIGAELICEERRGNRRRTWAAAAVGLLAGIGFWCNQLVFPAVAAVALGVALLAPRLLVRSRFWLASVLGFAAGSAPFWVWNARNGWESFQMAGSLVPDPVIALHNLRLLAVERLPALFGLHAPFSRLAVPAVLAAFFLPCMLSLRVFAPLPRRIHPDERPQPSGAKVQLALAFAFLSIFLACFAFSNFAIFPTPRYLLPVIPVFAVLVGVACASTRFRSANLLAVLVLLLLCAGQVRQFGDLAARGRESARRAAGYQDAADYLAWRGTDVAYCAFRHNSLNLYGGGAVAFTDSDLERIPAFRRRAELADAPAVVDDFLGIGRWVLASGGSACVTNVGGLRIATEIRPPSCAVEEVALEPRSVSADGVPDTAALLDRNYVTAWELDGDSGAIDITLPAPRPVCGVRMLVSGFDAKARIRVWGRSGPDAPFRHLSPVIPNVACRWSGPRLYPEPENPILEARFPAAQVDAVRIGLRAPVTDGALRKIRELQLLAPAAEGASPATAADWHEAVDALIDRLRRQGVNRLYASRWIANAVSEKSRGAIWTNHGPDLHPKPTGAPRPRTRPVPVVLDGSTALLVSPAGVPAMRTALGKCWIKMREVRAGALGVLFITESIQIFPWGRDEALGFLFDPDCPTFLPSAEWEERVIETPPNDLNWTQDYPPTIPYLRDALEYKLTDSRAAELRQMLDLLAEPTLGGEARFADLHVWRGARLLDPGARAFPGGGVRLRHYWSSPRRMLPDGRLRAFVHFIGPDGYRFQDDFALDIPPEGPDTTGGEDMVRLSILPDSVLKGTVPYSRYPINADVLWHVDRRIAIPKDAPTGLYEMRVGLYDAVYPSRILSVETRLPHRRKTVIVNPVFAITSKDSKDATP